MRKFTQQKIKTEKKLTDQAFNEEKTNRKFN